MSEEVKPRKNPADDIPDPGTPAGIRQRMAKEVRGMKAKIQFLETVAATLPEDASPEVCELIFRGLLAASGR